MTKVYEDCYHIDYRLQDCNGFEVYRIDYRDGKRKYQVWSECYCEFFDTLKEAKEFAKANNCNS
jgi:hypothetical protein